MAKAAKAAKTTKASEATAAGECCGADCCGPGEGCCALPMAGCCQVEAVVAVDVRGQMVLPKGVRESIRIDAGGKLAVVAWKKDGEVCCISLVPAEDLAESVRKAYGPLLRDIVR